MSLLAYGVSALLVVGLFAYAFVRSRTRFLSEAMDTQGMVIGVASGSRISPDQADLDEILYEPLRDEIRLWHADPPVFNDGALLPWIDLKDDRPALVEEEVPGELAELLDRAEELSGKVASLRGIVKNMTVAELKEQGDALKERAGIEKAGGTKIRLDVDGAWAKYVELSGIWLTRTGFRDWCEGYVERNHPDAETWGIVVLVADERAGGIEEAEEIARGVWDYLETQEIAVNLREETDELAEVGERILDRLDDVGSD